MLYIATLDALGYLHASLRGILTSKPWTVTKRLPGRVISPTME